MMRLVAVGVLTAALAVPAVGQARPAGERPVMLELARSLGEAHGARRLCHQATRNGSTMQDIVDMEAADEAFQKSLRNQFNDGYRASQGAFAACTPEAEKAEAAATDRISQRMRLLGQPT